MLMWAVVGVWMCCLASLRAWLPEGLFLCFLGCVRCCSVWLFVVRCGSCLCSESIAVLLCSVSRVLGAVFLSVLFCF